MIEIIPVLLFFIKCVYCDAYMGGFAQVGWNPLKPGQTHFSQLHISLDPDVWVVVWETFSDHIYVTLVLKAVCSILKCTQNVHSLAHQDPEI